jgi:periplasmic mercuric ion binding protein
MKKILLILIVTFIGFSINAQEIKKNKNAKYKIEVNGNCEQCKKRIQKAALSVFGVKSASWDIENHQLNLILNEEKCALEDVKNAIAKAGHDTETVKASNEAYDNLHSCCKYERK